MKGQKKWLLNSDERGFRDLVVVAVLLLPVELLERIQPLNPVLRPGI